MKLSLRWIAQHIENFSWPESEQKCLTEIIAPLGTRVAEIEQCTPLVSNPGVISGKIVSISPEGVLVRAEISRKEQDFLLPGRGDLAVGDTVVLTGINSNGGMQWGTHKDLGGDLETVLPAVTGVEKLSKILAEQDYIISIDNGAISHRPDLWGHRGWAREVAAILGYTMRPLEALCVNIPVAYGEMRYQDPRVSPIILELKPDTGCEQLAALWYPECVWQPTRVEIVAMLARVGGRGINALVDLTNYTMYDLGYPSHLFDGKKITDGLLQARKAYSEESVVLLNNNTVKLDMHDTVLADTVGVAALAGIMGAARTSITRTTEQVLCEVACLKPAAIRATRNRLGVSSEAATRFEKDLDSAAPVWVLRRIRALMAQYNIQARCAETIQVVGHRAPLERTIDLSHALLCARIGVTYADISADWTVQLLSRLGFDTRITGEPDAVVYVVQVPSWRMRDIQLPEDLIEELIRHYGYERISYVTPRIATVPHSIEPRIRARQMQDLCAWGLGMHELKSYAFFDESWCAELGWTPSHTINLKNPVSQNNYRLITTLVPHLLYAVYSNYRTAEKIRFFECNPIWKRTPAGGVQETGTIAGIFWEHKSRGLDFYTGKLMVEKLLYSVGYPVSWELSPGDGAPWWMPGQTAVIMSRESDVVVGYAGMLNECYGNLLPGSCFIFELNFDLLCTTSPAIPHFEPLSKYPITTLDVSVLISHERSVQELIEAIQTADARIIDICLYDRYENPAWKNRYSATIRYRVSDPTQNLTAENIAQVRTAVEQVLLGLGGEIR